MAKSPPLDIFNQTNAGGVTRCLMKETCQLSFGVATPLLAETLSFKVRALTSGEEAKHLTKHGLQLSPSFIRDVAQRIGRLSVEEGTNWQLKALSPEALSRLWRVILKEQPRQYAASTTKKRCVARWLSTEYAVAMLEAGKADFTN